MLIHDEGRWWVEDLGSTNGSYLDDERLTPGKRQPIVRGSVVRLGQDGPKFSIVQTAERSASPTLIEEAPTDSAAVTTPMAAIPVPLKPESAPVAALLVSLRDGETGDLYETKGDRVLVGRGRDCDVQLTRDDDTSVSRNHLEIVLVEGRVLLRDLGSRNGTFVNGAKLVGDHQLQLRDCIRFGPTGPELALESLTIPGYGPELDDEQAVDVQDPNSSTVMGSGWAKRRSFGGKGRTMFMREIVADSHRRHSRRMRRVVWSGVAVIVVSAGGFYWFTEMRVRETDVALEATARELERQQASSDSLREESRDEIARLGIALADARASSAPASVVDSLRIELDSARARTIALEEALGRAQADITTQLASIDSIRQAREGEVARLQTELRRAASNQVSQNLLDSLRAAVQEAEQRSRVLDDQARAIRGVDLAAVAQANQAAVGLVWAYTDEEVVYGSGFVLTASGFFITNRHVVMYTGRRADSVFVTMADQQQRVRAQIIRIPAARDPDLAVLRIVEYSGPAVASIDWDRNGARQGEPAAILGFPAGLLTAIDETETVRTSMNAGIFSKITQDRIQFDGFTITGSSGSPIFNAAGDVVAVHRAGLRDAVGLSFAVPVSLAQDLLPAEARRELGLPTR